MQQRVLHASCQPRIRQGDQASPRQRDCGEREPADPVASHSQLAVITDTGAIALSTLGGALLPVSMMPAIAQQLAPASPGYWAIGMFKAAVRGDAAGTLCQ